MGWFQGKKVQFGQRRPLGHQLALDASTPAVGLTPPAGATMAIIEVNAQNVRWRDDGTDPTAAIGMQIVAGNSFVYVGDLTAIKFFEEAATANLNVAYYE